MTITDIISLSLLFFLALKGFSRGFLRSLLGPLALLIATSISALYWYWTHNILISLCISLFGPFLLTMIFKLFLNTWKSATNPDGELSLLSRITGALLTLAWGMTIWVITLLLLSAVLPPINKPLEAIYKDLHLSYSYRMIKPLDLTRVDKAVDAKDDLKKLSEDQRIQDIVNDPQIAKDIKNKNYTALMANPKIMAIVKDPQLIKKMMTVYKNMNDEGGLPKE